MKPSTNLAILIDIDGGDISKEWIWNDFHPWQLRVLPGEAKTKLCLKLYETNTDYPLAGRKISGVITSHPIPLLPFEKGNLLIKTDSKVSLILESYTLSSGWEEYDKIEVPSDKLVCYKIDDNLIALRIKLEAPQGTNIRVSEVLLK